MGHPAIRSVEGFGVEGDLFFAGGFLLPVLPHPGFERLARCCVASGEGKGGDVGVGDGNPGPFIRRNDADSGLGQRGSGAAIEDVPVDCPAVFEGEGDVAAVVEGLLEGGVDLFVTGERRNPAFELLAFAPFGYFEFIRVDDVCRLGGHAVVPCVSTTLTLVSIWMRGLKLCTGLAGSLSRSSAPLS